RVTPRVRTKFSVYHPSIHTTSPPRLYHTPIQSAAHAPASAPTSKPTPGQQCTLSAASPSASGRSVEGLAGESGHGGAGVGFAGGERKSTRVESRDGKYSDVVVY